MILQRYTFGSKSQRALEYSRTIVVVYDIAKIYIWKQITTARRGRRRGKPLFMILQRYTFGSKSQLKIIIYSFLSCCLWYCKDIHLEANHNFQELTSPTWWVVYDIAKIYIWKQITTLHLRRWVLALLFMILQRYTFGSKSQLCG